MYKKAHENNNRDMVEKHCGRDYWKDASEVSESI